MLLVVKLNFNELKTYRDDFIKCLHHNSNNIYIKDIFIFLDIIDNTLPNFKKVKYIVKPDYSKEDIIEYSKKISKSEYIILSEPFVKIGSLLKYKNIDIIDNKNYTIFNRRLKPNFNTTRKNSIKQQEIKKVLSIDNKKIFKENVASKLDVIIVSVNYNDYLSITLEKNTKIFDNITVVTSEDDIECQEICNNYNVNYIICEDIVRNGVINKSLGINKGIKSIEYPDWILVLDADIIVEDRIDIDKLNKGVLYTSSRWIIEDIKEYNHYKIGDKDLSEFKFESNKGIGFFQLFNFSKKQSYPESDWGRYSDSTWSDIIFKKGFKNNESVNINVIHLGKPYQKWIKKEKKIIKRYKIVFLTCVYKRPKVTEIFINMLEITQRKLFNYFDFTNIVVDSEKTNISLFEKKNFIYTNYTNQPVSEKWNYALSLCRKLDFDYVFIIGSDDLIDEKLMLKYHELMESGYDYFGITDLYFLEYETGNFFYWPGYDNTSGRMGETIGIGRCISKNIINKVNFKLWTDGINRGLDLSMDRIIKKLPNIKHTKISLGKEYFACDIKSDFNISDLNSYKNLIPVKDSNIDFIYQKNYLSKSKIKSIMLSDGDFAGSGNKIKESIISQNNNIEMYLVVKKEHKYGYSSDFILTNENKNIIQNLINNCDIVHFKGDNLPSLDWYGIKIPKNKKIIITVGGSGFRRGEHEKLCLEWYPIEDYLKMTDFRSSITPDLNYVEFEGEYIPHALDTKSKKNLWKRSETLVIQHSPSNRSKKGSDDIIIPALEDLKKENIKIKIDILEGITNKECIERKKQGTIFIDQICETGFYGMSAIESMQFGIPVISWISEKSILQSNRKIDKECPIIICKNKEELKEKIRYYSKNLNELETISKKTKIYVDNLHSYESVGKIWGEIYNKIYSNR